MQEISMNEARDVSGGLVPLVIGVLATDAFAIGFTVGAITGYATIHSLFKMR